MRFVAEAICVRKTNGLEIVFWDNKSLVVKAGLTVVWFHHWFYSPRGFHAESYGRFVRCLKNHRHLSLPYIYRIAQKYSIEWQYGRMPSLEGKNIKELNPEGRKRNAIENR